MLLQQSSQLALKPSSALLPGIAEHGREARPSRPLKCRCIRDVRHHEHQLRRAELGSGLCVYQRLEVCPATARQNRDTCHAWLLPVDPLRQFYSAPWRARGSGGNIPLESSGG
jgi:hypothetical protein